MADSVHVPRIGTAPILLLYLPESAIRHPRLDTSVHSY